MSPALLVALAALAAAPAARDESIQAGVKLAQDELEAWDPAAARKLADELVKRAPGVPDVEELVAHLRFEEGNYAGAVELLDKVGASDDFAALARATLKESKSWGSRESEHFTIFYREGKDAVLALYALDTLEKQRAAPVWPIRSN